ncbi:MAG: FKBP-type peptidyl-prolyl cis-trans isomerase [Candidatus Saccharimonadales bacterium]
MKKRVWLVVGLVSLIVIVGAGWAWQAHQNKQKEEARQIALAQAAASASTGSKLPSDGTTGIVIKNDSVVPSTTSPNQSTPAPSTPTASTSPAANQGEKATLNPSEFGQYDKYKTAQNAVFADIAVGSGAEATVGKKLGVNYRGWLTNGSIFDQNVDATKPFSFTLGAGSVIPGWEQAIAGMKVGGERLLIIPPAAGYGNIPQGPIPADSVLVFYVKLLAAQ